MHGSCTPEHRATWKASRELHGYIFVDAFGIYHGGAACIRITVMTFWQENGLAPQVVEDAFRAIHAVKNGWNVKR